MASRNKQWLDCIDIHALVVAEQLVANKGMVDAGFRIMDRTVDDHGVWAVVGTDCNFTVRCCFGTLGHVVKVAVLRYLSDSDHISDDYRETYNVAGLAAPLMVERTKGT